MVFFVAAFGLLLHVLLWGAGAALLLTPRPWRNAWPIFCGPMGLALQSAVVWAGAYSGLAGADVYARWSEVIPILLLVVAISRGGLSRVSTGISKFRWLGLLVAAELALLVLPMSQASRSLTTFSLGSCDAADYAAGARVFQEFARSDRTGFLGLTEVVSVASVDNFYDFWLRLNHFTPSALIAFNGAVFGQRPHEITSLMTALLLVMTVPAVFWLARTVVRYSARTSLWIAAIYGLNPITWYAVAHVAMGQLLAAQAIAVVTWAGVALWRGRLNWRHGCAMSGVLAMGYWLILGSYNFIVIVALTPALAYVGVAALFSGKWGKLGRWLVAMLAPLLACGVVFTQRALGLIERFQLFGQYDFGWRIPVISPEGWLGAVSDAALNPYAAWVRGILLGLLAGLLLATLMCDRRQRRWMSLVAVAMVAPVMIGYVYLEVRGSALGTNASYDAYKLLAVFFPGLLCAVAYWATLSRSRVTILRYAAVAGIVAVTGLNLVMVYRFSARMKNPPLIVSADMVELQGIEDRSEVASLNMKIEDFWTRLWANAFLLRKAQYFPTHTYEGRRNTELKGEWDLIDGIITLSTPAGEGAFRVGQSFSVAKNTGRYFLRGRLGDGWYAEERIPRAMRRWHWAKGDATLVLENPQATARTITLHVWVRSLDKRDLQIRQDGSMVGVVQLDETLGERVVPNIILPPGVSTITFASSTAPKSGFAGDARALAFAVYGIELEVRTAGDLERL